MSLELEDHIDQYNRYVELHNVSIKAIETVCIKICLLKKLMKIFEEETISFLQTRLVVRLEDLISEFIEILAAFKKKKKFCFRKIDEMIENGKSEESEEMAKLAEFCDKIDSMEIPHLPEFKDESGVKDFFISFYLVVI